MAGAHRDPSVQEERSVPGSAAATDAVLHPSRAPEFGALRDEPGIELFPGARSPAAAGQHVAGCVVGEQLRDADVDLDFGELIRVSLLGECGVGELGLLAACARPSRRRWPGVRSSSRRGRGRGSRPPVRGRPARGGRATPGRRGGSRVQARAQRFASTVSAAAWACRAWSMSESLESSRMSASALRRSSESPVKSVAHGGVEVLGADHGIAAEVLERSASAPMRPMASLSCVRSGLRVRGPSAPSRWR